MISSDLSCERRRLYSYGEGRPLTAIASLLLHSLRTLLFMSFTVLCMFLFIFTCDLLSFTWMTHCQTESSCPITTLQPAQPVCWPSTPQYEVLPCQIMCSMMDFRSGSRSKRIFSKMIIRQKLKHQHNLPDKDRRADFETEQSDWRVFPQTSHQQTVPSFLLVSIALITLSRWPISKKVAW